MESHNLMHCIYLIEQPQQSSSKILINAHPLIFQ